jgi:Tol biopolymer transport system component
MKAMVTIFILIVAPFHSLSAQDEQIEFPRLSGFYFGQKLPGMTPELFAPGIISLGYHEHHVAISPDGMEMYYTIFSTNPMRAMIMYTKNLNGMWTIPSIAPFSDSGMNLHPSFSSDGKKLFFCSTRSLSKKNNSKNNADIWFVERKGNSWSEPVNAGYLINTEFEESSPFVDAAGTLFFESNRNTNKADWDIYKSDLKEGSYQKAEKLPFPINTENGEYGPCISPDGNYLLFYSDRPGTYGESDIYVSFKRKDGEWDEPINLGEKINSKYYDWSPGISPDGKYIFFSSYRNIESILSKYKSYSDTVCSEFGIPKIGFGTIYWVKAKIIEDLKPKKLR